MGQPQKLEALERADEEPTESRRHRPVSEIRFVEATLPVSLVASGSLTEESRAWLWAVVHATLFAPSEELEGWSSGVRGRPAVRRVWASFPIHGDPDRIPDDAASVLEDWFLLVEPCDVFTFIEGVHESLEPALRLRFAASINIVLERGKSDHRFVQGRLMPITSRADITALERALAACTRARWNGPEAHLRDALARLAHKPEPDARGAVQEAIRAVERAATLLTKEEHFDLEDALDALEAEGHVERGLRSAYSGLFAFVSTTTRRPTTDDARIILVMCAGLVSHLAARTP